MLRVSVLCLVVIIISCFLWGLIMKWLAGQCNGSILTNLDRGLIARLLFLVDRLASPPMAVASFVAFALDQTLCHALSS